MSRAERRRQAREQAKTDKHPSLGEDRIIGVRMSPDLAPSDHGMPRRVTRQWVVENSTEGRLGAVRIPVDRQDRLMSHVEYWPDCPHIDEDCQCEDDETVMWELMEFSGGEW